MDRLLDPLRPWLARLPIERFRNPPPVVAVIRLAGPIGPLAGLRTGLTLARLAPLIERAFSIRSVKAVALAINSPGGSAAQAALIAKRIRDLADEKKVPVVAFAEDVAASGGYWLACAADEIYADANSIVGSIGVIAAGFGFADLIRKAGVRRRIYTAGDRKSLLDPFRPEAPEEVERLEAIQRDIHDNFQAWVRERRGQRLKGPEDELFSGEFWTGRRALELGLIDGLDDVRAAMRRRFGDHVRLRPVGAEPFRLRRLVGLESDPGGEPAGFLGEAVAALEVRALWGRFGL
ncbi:MAG: S49 family peptidase [Pseudomonadota bacterium]